MAPNRPPVFTVDPITAADATEDAVYHATLADSASDPNVGDTLTFAKLSGPDWLQVAPDGGLSGTPSNSDVGPNAFTIRVSDPSDLSDTATLAITVLNVNDAPRFLAIRSTACRARPASRMAEHWRARQRTSTPAIRWRTRR